MRSNFLSTTFSANDDKIPTHEFDSVFVMRRRQPVKDVLSRKIKEAGITAPEIVRRAAEKNHPVGRTSITEILAGGTQNPGIFTIEAIAIGMDLSPEQLAAEIFGSRTDDPAFKGSQFAIMCEIYQSMTTAQRQKALPHLEGLLVQLRHIKSQ